VHDCGPLRAGARSGLSDNLPNPHSRTPRSAGIVGLMAATRPSAVLIAIGVLLVLAAPVSSRADDTFTATATINGDTLDRAQAQSVDATFIITRYTTDAESQAVAAALRKGPAELHALFKTMPDIGHIEVRDRTIPIKYAYRRPENTARLAIVTDVPIAFLDAGVKDKPKEGYDFGLAILDFSLPGFGSGEVNPAVKLAMSSSGQIFTQEYGATIVRLSNVQQKK
jgi:hypothetical protein